MVDECWRTDFKDIHDVLITVAKEAGRMITGAEPIAGKVGSKKNCESMCDSLYHC